MARLLRFFKLVKTMKGFDSLVLMVTSIVGSMSILLWTVVVLVLVLMVIALFIQTACEEYIAGDAEILRRQDVFMYYGTFWRSLLTMFELTVWNWMPPTRSLVENISEWFMLFSIVRKMIIGFSAVSVITGVFIQ